jgi:hypothetical protein
LSITDQRPSPLCAESIDHGPKLLQFSLFLLFFGLAGQSGA